MFMMALMLFVIVVSYLLMFGLVKFAVSVIDKALPAKLRDAISSDFDPIDNMIYFLIGRRVAGQAMTWRTYTIHSPPIW